MHVLSVVLSAHSTRFLEKLLQPHEYFRPAAPKYLELDYNPALTSPYSLSDYVLVWAGLRVVVGHTWL